MLLSPWEIQHMSSLCFGQFMNIRKKQKKSSSLTDLTVVFLKKERYSAFLWVWGCGVEEGGQKDGCYIRWPASYI